MVKLSLLAININLNPPLSIKSLFSLTHLINYHRLSTNDGNYDHDTTSKCGCEIMQVRRP